MARTASSQADLSKNMGMRDKLRRWKFTELHMDETWFDIDSVLSNITPKFLMFEEGVILSEPMVRVNQIDNEQNVGWK